MTAGENVLLAWPSALPVGAQHLAEGWVERHEPELACLADQLDLIVFVVDLLPEQRARLG